MRIGRVLRRRAGVFAAATAVAAPALRNLLARSSRADAPRVSYGHRRIPGAGEVAHGGMLKLQALQEIFPASDRFDVAYLVSSALPAGAVTFARLARLGGAKLVLNQNGVATPAWPGPGWRSMNRPLQRLVEDADFVFYQSEFCRESADRFLGARPGPSEVLYNAVDTGVFAPAASDPDPRSLTLLLGGNQDHRYRLESALRTVAVLARSGEAVRLLVTGRFRWAANEADSAAEAEQLVQSLGLREQVSFLGAYTARQAPEILRRAHILLHTQYNDASPRLVVEAMACGLPVVYSRSGGTPELVGERAGVGVEVEQSFDKQIAPDPEALAEAVRSVARERARFAQAARARAVERFDARPWLERHRRLFASLTGRPAAS